MVYESSDAWERKDAIEERIRNFPRAAIICDGPGCTQQAPRHRCSKCFCNYYCSRECQKKDWKGHKTYCLEVEEQRTMPVSYPDDINDIPETACTREAVNIECPICLENPMKHRIVLKQCRHGFCLSCLLNLETYHYTFRDDSDSTFCCPYCREEVEGCVESAALERSVYFFDRANNRTTKDSKETKIDLLQKAVDCLDVVLSVDNPFLKAYYRKAENLVFMGEGQKALETLKLLFLASKNSSDHPVMKLIHQLNLAADRNDAVSNVLLQRKIAEAVEEHGLPAIPLRPDYIFSSYILQGMAYHQQEKWNEAITAYRGANLLLNHDPLGTAQSQLTLILSSMECYYEAKEYKNLFFVYDRSMNSFYRRFPTMHKWKAMALEKLGQLDDAIVTMAQAVLYETPWDPINQDENLNLYDELCRRRDELTKQKTAEDKI